MALEGTSRRGVKVRLAYLCNLYPAVSHSFVRREIEAVEQAGHEVHRYSLRPAREDLRDAADLKEAERTETILRQSWLAILAAAALLLVSRPARTFRAIATARSLSAPGLKSKARHFAYWLEAAWLTRRLERLRIDHLHAHFGTNPAAVATIVRAWGGPPFSFTVHGPDEFDAPLALSLPGKIERARLVAAISSYGRSQLMRLSNPANWDKIAVVRCGVDRAYLDADAVPAPSDSRELVCVARLSVQKGLPLLISACETLKASGERFTLTIIGDGEMREELEAEIEQRGLRDHVRLAGVRTATEIREHLFGSRALVLPSFAEGLPVVLMEALALGRPVIATAIAGIPELVDSDCGWLIPAGSQEELVQAMNEALAASPDELAAKGAVGRGRVRRLHDAAMNAEQLLKAISAAG